jgi:hypothetical protein
MHSPLESFWPRTSQPRSSCHTASARKIIRTRHSSHAKHRNLRSNALQANRAARNADMGRTSAERQQRGPSHRRATADVQRVQKSGQGPHSCMRQTIRCLRTWGCKERESGNTGKSLAAAADTTRAWRAEKEKWAALFCCTRGTASGPRYNERKGHLLLRASGRTGRLIAHVCASCRSR